MITANLAERHERVPATYRAHIQGQVIGPQSWWPVSGYGRTQLGGAIATAPGTNGRGAVFVELGSIGRVTGRRPKVPVLLMALRVALFLGGSLSERSLAKEQPATSCRSCRSSQGAQKVSSHPFLGQVRLQGRFALRSGKGHHFLPVPWGWDDPDDDETSDDPNDDDDGWENVNGVREPELLITAFLPVVGCFLNDSGPRSEHVQSESPLLTSFLKPQRLRC